MIGDCCEELKKVVAESSEMHVSPNAVEVYIETKSGKVYQFHFCPFCGKTQKVDDDESRR